MPIVLTLHRAREPADRQRESRTLDEGSLTIGRGPGNGWVLQDPAQHLSKTHCIVSAVPGGWVLTDTSSNGVFLNGARQRMARDSQARLGDGDEFTLGDYLVQVRVVAALGRGGVAGLAAVDPRGVPPVLERDDPFGLDDFLAPRSVAGAPAPAAPPAGAADPFGLDDFLAPPRAPAPKSSGPGFDPFADPARAGREDPFGDGFDDLMGAPPTARPFNDPAPPVHGRAAPDPFDEREKRPTTRDPFGGGARVPDAFGADDDLFRGSKPAVEWQGPSQPDDADPLSQAFGGAKPITPAPIDDWDDLLGDTPPGMAHAPAPVPPPAPLAPAPTTVPVAPQPPAVVPPVPAATPAMQAGGATEALLAAFLDGAGVPGLDVSKQSPEEYFRGVGALFAAMVESLRDVLMSRAVVKGEFGVEQTMLRARDNNALKFSVTPQDAVSALLQPGRPGYMDPLRATKEAFDDVRVHQIAVMAGVQAALFNLLRTFDPAALEGRLQKGGVMESLVPSTRRAKLWESFCATYKDIARDADSDFQAVFGREFARAYTEQVKAK